MASSRVISWTLASATERVEWNETEVHCGRGEHGSGNGGLQS